MLQGEAIEIIIEPVVAIGNCWCVKLLKIDLLVWVMVDQIKECFMWLVFVIGN